MFALDDARREAEAARREAEAAHLRVVQLQREQEEERKQEREQREREHEEPCQVRGQDWSVRSALIRAYLLGRSGFKMSKETLDRLMQSLEDYDVMRLERVMVAMKRDLASLRREVEASRGANEVVALKVRDRDH